MFQYFSGGGNPSNWTQKNSSKWKSKKRTVDFSTTNRHSEMSEMHKKWFECYSWNEDKRIKKIGPILEFWGEIKKMSSNKMHNIFKIKYDCMYCSRTAIHRCVNIHSPSLIPFYLLSALPFRSFFQLAHSLSRKFQFSYFPSCCLWYLHILIRFSCSCFSTHI